MRHSMQHCAPFLLALACTLTLACADRPLPAAPTDAPLAASAANKSAQSTLPIKGHLVGTTITTRISDTPLTYRLDNSAVGVVSHLGKTTATWSVPTVIFDVANLQIVVTSGDWTGTLTAANGDQLHGEYTFRDTTIDFTLLGSFEALLDIHVTGGTGRFANVQGDAVAVVRGNVFTEEFTIDFQGAGSLTGH